MNTYKNLRDKSVLIDMGSFQSYGGWALDTQFTAAMGVPYLLAHGLGTPVKDAKTRARFCRSGSYRVWAYTFNWVAPWKPEYAPGVFQVGVDGKLLAAELGNQGDRWNWQDAGTAELREGDHEIVLHDLTGFEGRCGLLFFSLDHSFEPPRELPELTAFFQEMTGNLSLREESRFDLVVAGGGIAGICCALSAARRGLKTALIHDRLIVGGNNSSEIRVWLGGETNFDPYPGVGNLVRELEQKEKGHYGDVNQARLYEDEKKLALLQQEPKISLYLGHILTDAKSGDHMIRSVVVYDVRECCYRTLSAPYFADCTGDGALGFLTGADYEVTTNGHMGMTNFWYITNTGTPQEFPRCPWAIDLSNVEFPGRGEVRDVYRNQREISLGCWFWESGMEHDPIEKAEYARDTNFRAMYGAWDTLKNADRDYPSWRLGFSAYMGGRRESRRLLGDIVLDKSHVQRGVEFPDRCVPSTWDLDVHYPDRRFYAAFHEGDGFLTKDYRGHFKAPYFLPYRCLYSRNIANLFMAGRDVSVSHDALGTARTMRTGGMMGEVVGVAAELCKEHDALPRDVYETYLDDFKSRLSAL